jgi:hypothetical protein
LLTWSLKRASRSLFEQKKEAIGTPTLPAVVTGDEVPSPAAMLRYAVPSSVSRGDRDDLPWAPSIASHVHG